MLLLPPAFEDVCCITFDVDNLQTFTGEEGKTRCSQNNVYISIIFGVLKCAAGDSSLISDKPSGQKEGIQGNYRKKLCMDIVGIQARAKNVQQQYWGIP